MFNITPLDSQKYSIDKMLYVFIIPMEQNSPKIISNTFPGKKSLKVTTFQYLRRL